MNNKKKLKAIKKIMNKSPKIPNIEDLEENKPLFEYYCEVADWIILLKHILE